MARDAETEGQPGTEPDAGSVSRGRIAPDGSEAATVTVDLETARLIARAFLPINPNKMRNAAPEVVAAAHAFRAAVAKAEASS